MQKEHWSERYAQPEFAYGEAPNEFFKEQIEMLAPGKILMPADGEGRNGVYAASLGWEVHAFDLSLEGKKKALQLAEKHNVKLHFDVGDFAELSYEAESFDAMGLIFAHFPPDKRKDFHHRLVSSLKPGGTVIFEAFSKEHLNYNSKNPGVGGPKLAPALFSIEEIHEEFPGIEPTLLEETVVDLNEGKYHIGQGSVIRFVGKKA